MKRFILTLVVLLVAFSGCIYSAPKEPQAFEEINKDKTVWEFSVFLYSKYISYYNYANSKEYNLGFNWFPNNGDTKFMIKKIANVSIWDTKSKMGLLWPKSQEKDEFNPPRKLTYGEHIPNVGPFDDSRHGLSIKSRYLSNPKKLQPTEEGWTVYLFDYDVRGTKGRINVDTEIGKVLVFTSNKNDKMLEVYSSDGQWEYVRYLEFGEGPEVSQPNDPVNIIEVMGDIWYEKVFPILEQNESLISEK